MKRLDSLLGRIERFLEERFYLMAEKISLGYDKREGYEEDKRITIAQNQ